jgi:hypothetical protein
MEQKFVSDDIHIIVFIDVYIGKKFVDRDIHIIVFIDVYLGKKFVGCDIHIIVSTLCWCLLQLMVSVEGRYVPVMPGVTTLRVCV